MSKKAGTSQLGHSPFGREKLEGPKKHHDDHGKHASVPSKGMTCCEHWERPYDLNASSKNMGYTQGADFAPKCPEDRKTTYLKVNREDH